MPSFEVTYENGNTVPFTRAACFAALASTVHVPAKVVLQLDYGFMYSTWGGRLEEDKFYWDFLFDLLEPMGFGKWLGGVSVELNESREESRGTCGKVTFDKTIPIPIVVSMMSLLRKPGEGRGHVLKKGIEWGFCPRLSLFLDELYALRKIEDGKQVYWNHPQGEHGVVFAYYEGIPGLRYFLEWEKQDCPIIHGDMGEWPTYFGRHAMLAGGSHLEIGARSLRRAKSLLSENELKSLFKKVEKRMTE